MWAITSYLDGMMIGILVMMVIGLLGMMIGLLGIEDGDLEDEEERAMPPFIPLIPHSRQLDLYLYNWGEGGGGGGHSLAK